MALQRPVRKLGRANASLSETPCHKLQSLTCYPASNVDIIAITD